MRTSALVLPACMLFGFDPTIPDRQDGIAALQGVWCLMATADAKHIDRGSPDCTMTIGADGRVVLRIGAVVTNEGTVRVCRAGRLHGIDLQFATGQVLGVYELQGSTLTICCNEAAKPRPSSLRPEGRQWLETWKRVMR